MPKCEFTKEFDILIQDFNNQSQHAIAALNAKAEKEAEKETEEGEQEEEKEKEKEKEVEEVDEDDIFTANLDKLHASTRSKFRNFDRQAKELDANRKEVEKEVREHNKLLSEDKLVDPKPLDTEKINAEFLKPFSDAADKLGKALEGFTLRIRSQLVGRKDLGAQFTRAANDLFIGLKKLDEEVDKFAATEEKRKPKEQKELEVMPSKFLADFKGIIKKHPPEGPPPKPGAKPDDKKLDKIVKDVEDRLKKIDTNNGFGRVTSLCEAAQGMLKELMKNLGKDDAKLLGELKELVAAIEKYDNHMFLLNRMR
jgi:hypothetical protein